MLKLAKLLHHKGLHITFVNTEYNHKRFLKSTSLGPDSSQLGGDRFRFETIPDGMPPSSDPDATQDVPSLCESTRKNFSAPLLELIAEINGKARAEQTDGVVSPPPVSCLVVDGLMPFAGGSVARQLGVPLVKFFPISACGLVGLQQYRPLLERGLVPLKGEPLYFIVLDIMHRYMYFIYQKFYDKKRIFKDLVKLLATFLGFSLRMSKLRI